MGLCFSADVFFLSPRNLRAPSANCSETLPHDRMAEFYNASTKIGGGAYQKTLRARNMQNFTNGLEVNA